MTPPTTILFSVFISPSEKKGGGGVVVCLLSERGLAARLTPPQLDSSSPLSAFLWPLIWKWAQAPFANQGGIISPEHLATTTIIHASDPGWAALSLSFNPPLAIGQDLPWWSPSWGGEGGGECAGVQCRGSAGAQAGFRRPAEHGAEPSAESGLAHSLMPRAHAGVNFTAPLSLSRCRAHTLAPVRARGPHALQERG